MKPLRENILIVDDEPGIRLMLRTTLEGAEYQVLESSDGQEALGVIGKSRPDLIILDLAMPVLDGMGVLEQLSSEPPTKRPRVIVLTAHGSVPQAVKAIRLGADDFLEKPILPEDLRLSVAAVLEEAALDRHHSPDLSVSYSALLERIRGDIWRRDYHHAAMLLMDAAWAAGTDPAYFNLIGVLHEAEGRKRLAKRFYRKALAAKEQYEPARLNLQRLDEISRRGESDLEVQLGDEARLLDGSNAKS
jgi:CheY-like chemotaxis protein